MNAAVLNSELARKEVLRLEALDRYEVLNASLGPAISELAELAAKICDTPMAGVSFVASDYVRLCARYGIEETELPLGSLPDAGEQSLFEVPDTRLDPDFSPEEISLGGRRGRYYAAAALVLPGEMHLGSLFVIDEIPRQLTDLQWKTLTVLAGQVMASIELSHAVRQMESVARARKRVELALTVERNFISTVLDTVDALVVVYDTNGRIVRFNRACEEASGYDFPTLAGRPLWEKLIPDSDVPSAVRNFEQLRSEGFPTAFEDQWKRRDGNLRHIAWSASPLFDDRGKINYIIATGIDVTVQREAEATLRESESRYRQLVENSLGMVSTHDLDGRLLSVNAHGAHSLGYTREQVVGHRMDEYVCEQFRPNFDLYLSHIRIHHEAQGLAHLQHVNGEVHVVAFRNRLIEAPAREPYVLGFGIDITEQVRAEEKLRALMRQSNSVLESVGDGIYGTDLEGNVTVINAAALQMLGYKAEEVLGRNMHALVHHTRADGSLYPASESPVQNTIHCLDTVRIFNEVFWRKDGTSFPVEYVACPQIVMEYEPKQPVEPQIQAEIPFDSIGDPDGEATPEFAEEAAPAVPDARPVGKAVGVVVAFTDTTERRALDRMKDEFISTVSHELRTPLTSLRAALGLIAGGTLDARPKKFQQMLEIASENTDRLVRLVNDILEMERIGSGKSELHSTLCSTDDLFRCAIGLQQADADKARIRLVCTAHGVNVWADPDRILQTLTNLISNAIKFSPPDTEIRLSARRIDTTEAVIQVRDQGRGIPRDKLDTIFERFHQVDASDSRTMGGTGLGLAICRSILTQHGGRIWATSPLGKGSIFHFTLPTRPASNLL